MMTSVIYFIEFKMIIIFKYEFHEIVQFSGVTKLNKIFCQKLYNHLFILAKIGPNS